MVAEAVELAGARWFAHGLRVVALQLVFIQRVNTAH